MSALPSDSPWMNLRQAAAYLPGNRSPRFVAREIKAGRLRAARIGGRGEYVTCDRWLQEWLEEQARPIETFSRRRA